MQSQYNLAWAESSLGCTSIRARMHLDRESIQSSAMQPSHLITRSEESRERDDPMVSHILSTRKHSIHQETEQKQDVNWSRISKAFSSKIETRHDVTECDCVKKKLQCRRIRKEQVQRHSEPGQPPLMTSLHNAQDKELSIIAKKLTYKTWTI